MRQVMADDATGRCHDRHQQCGDDLEICQMDDDDRGDEQHNGRDDDMNNRAQVLLPRSADL